MSNSLYEVVVLLCAVFLCSIPFVLLFGFLGHRWRFWSWSRWIKTVLGAFITIALTIPIAVALGDWFYTQGISPELGTLIIMAFICTAVMILVLLLRRSYH